jgi:hypothetical protein
VLISPELLLLLLLLLLLFGGGIDNSWTKSEV